MLTVCLAFIVGLGYSLFAQNFFVGGDGLELSTLVAPPIPDEAPPPEPEPDKPAPKQAANVDVRKEIIANIMENPKKVEDIKTTKMEIKARRENVPTIKGDVESNTYSSSKPPPTKRDLEGAQRGFGDNEGKAKATPKPPEKKAAPPPPPPPPKPPVPKRSSKGGVNGSAISRPKPRYPAAARAVNAKGSVSVAIVISKSGRVMSASARSGHPLLKQAAVAAARRAKFRPTLLSGQAVEVSGVIVYNFQ
jgi:protein TonB